MRKGVLPRIIGSGIVLGLYGIVNFLATPIGTIASGNIASKQFENSDASYVASQAGMDFFSNLHMPFFFVLIILVAIWWKPVVNMFRKAGVTAIPIILLSLLSLAPESANAYYDKQNWAEPVFILPNESAFWIPETGANRGNQSRLNSEAYLAQNEIAAKRFNIPHAKLPNSAWLGDFYVPTGRLIILDRTPYTREWVKDAMRGTSKRDESFHMQTRDGMNSTVGLAVGASIDPGNAPGFLYRFGVNAPRGERTDPKVIFTSVYYGRSLAQIMDTVVRNKVQQLLSAQYSKLTFDEANEKLPEIITLVEKDLKNWAKTIGITIDFLGLADTVEFDSDVQQAINKAYIAGRLAPHVNTLERMATINAMEHKWNGWLPWTPGSLGDIFRNIFGIKSNPVPAKAVRKAAK